MRETQGRGERGSKKGREVDRGMRGGLRTDSPGVGNPTHQGRHRLIPVSGAGEQVVRLSKTPSGKQRVELGLGLGRNSEGFCFISVCNCGHRLEQLP